MAFCRDPRPTAATSMMFAVCVCPRWRPQCPMPCQAPSPCRHSLVFDKSLSGEAQMARPARCGATLPAPVACSPVSAELASHAPGNAIAAASARLTDSRRGPRKRKAHVPSQAGRSVPGMASPRRGLRICTSCSRIGARSTPSRTATVRAGGIVGGERELRCSTATCRGRARVNASDG
jgi:hypothetical protein